MNQPALWALGIVFAITQLINLTYLEGLSGDFSDLVLQVVADNGTYNAPYMVVDKADGAWIVLNATLPENTGYSLNILSSSDGGGSFEKTNDPSIIEVSYQEGFAQDFSNLAVAFMSPDGMATPVTYSLIGMSEGQWAIIALPRPPMAGETISLMAKVGDVPPSSLASVPSGDGLDKEVPELNDTNESIPSVEPTLEPETTDSVTETADSAGEPPSIRVFDAKGNEHKAENKRKGGVLKVKFDESPITEIAFTGLNSTNSSLGLDFPDDVPAPEGKAWSRVYAIDPSKLEFSGATVSVTAEGYELYKCRDWDFEGRQCLGEWEFLMDIAPGLEYTIELGPADPGFAERGPTDWAYDSDGNDVLSLVNASDDNYATKLVTTSYGVNASWATGIPPGTAINGSNFKCEMRAGLGLIGSVIREWYNQSSGTWTTVCSDSGLLLPTSDTMFECDVKDYVEHDPDNPVLRCRATSVLSVAIYFDYLGLNMTANDTLNGCTVIGASGAYSLGGNLSGAPNTGTNGYKACVIIASDNVTLDCAGHSIANDDSADTSGIMVNGHDDYPDWFNLTIMNCDVRDYGSAVLIDSTSSYKRTINLTNNTLASNIYGVNVTSGYVYLNLSGNLIANNTGAGVRDANYFGEILEFDRDRLLGNAQDLSYPSGGSGLLIDMNDVLLGKADGSQAANASIYHWGDHTWGAISYYPSPPPPSSGLVAFANKSFNITYIPYYFPTTRTFDLNMSWGAAEGALIDESLDPDVAFQRIRLVPPERHA